MVGERCRNPQKGFASRQLDRRLCEPGAVQGLLCALKVVFGSGVTKRSCSLEARRRNPLPGAQDWNGIEASEPFRCPASFLAFPVGWVFGWMHEKGARKRLFSLV